MVVERVGHPVAKVVNPLGTVITVSADEEDITLSQQDYEEDCSSFTSLSTPTTCSTASSNICAEEGKLTGQAVGDKELEAGGRELRDHTEICAEMRPANEPAAIDSVSPDSIEELKEQRTLCAEAATTATSCARVDLDRVRVFKDVPSSPSLCAERGAVPDCSNVIQTTGRIRCIVGILDEEEIKPTLDKELGFQMIDEQERPPDNASVIKVNTSSSDDDLVHVNKEELVVVAPPKKKQPVSSDDDIEHVLHSDVVESSESQKTNNRNSRKRSKDKQRVLIPTIVETVPDVSKDVSKDVTLKDSEKPVFKESEVLQQQQQPQPQSHSKKTRVRSKRQPPQTLSNDMVEIINMDLPTPELLLAPEQPPTPPESPPPTPPQTPPPPPPPAQPLPAPIEKFDDPSDMVEIIDIDAEKSSGCFQDTPPPDCQILLPKQPELVKKRNKRQKHQQPSPRQRTEFSKTTESSPEKEISQELGSPPPPPPNVWMLRSRSSSVIKSDDTESKSLLKIEADEEEANKENFDITKEEIINLPSEIIEEAMEDTVTFEKPIICEEPMEDVICNEKSLFHEEFEKEPEKQHGCTGSPDEEVVMPMDIKEEQPYDREQRELSILSDKSSCVAAGDVSVVLPASASLPAKKNSRSKKKKRR